MGINLKRYFRLRRWINSIRYAIVDPTFKFDNHLDEKVKRLLIIKTEAIGDYVLFRNFLKEIRNSRQYKDFKITLLGNELWQPLAEKFDTAFYDESVFINRNRFLKDKNYRRKIFQNIGSNLYEEAVNCTYSREFMLGDLIIRSVRAKIKTGMAGDSASEIPILNLIGRHYYNNLIHAGDNEIFEFKRNKIFFEKWLQKEISLKAPVIEILSERKPYAVILPGAQDKKRRWDILKFKSVGAYLNTKFGYEIMIAGGPADYEIAEEMIDDNNRNFTHNICGKNKLEDLPGLLAAARIAICNDSGTLHIAAAVNTPCVCISNANHYGRFSPYPSEAGKELAILYPPTFLKKYNSEMEKIKAVAYGSKFSIDEISVESVQTEIERLLNG